MAETCAKSNETNADLLKTATELSKEYPEVAVVKDLASYNVDDVKIRILQQTCSYIIFQVKYGHQSFLVKKLIVADAQEETLLAREAKGLLMTSPTFTPIIYCRSDRLKSLALEDLSEYGSLAEKLSSGQVDKPMIHRIAEALAEIHKSTHVRGAQPDQFKEFAEDFDGQITIHFLNDLLKVNLETIEDGIWKEAVTRVTNSEAVKSLVSSMVEVAKTKKEALLRGRLTAESVLVDADKVKMTDGQFVFVGPCAWDVGHLLAIYLSSYHEHMLTEENNDWHRNISYQMVDAAKDTVERYKAVMGEYLEDKEFISQVAAFCGLKLIDRAFNSIKSPSKATEVLESGLRLVNAHQRIPHVDRLVVIALMLTH